MSSFFASKERIKIPRPKSQKAARKDSSLHTCDTPKRAAVDNAVQQAWKKLRTDANVVLPNNPWAYQQRRVAKYFQGDSSGDILYLGTVSGHFICNDLGKSANFDCWHISYDDGDQEDWDYQELQTGLQLWQHTQNPPTNPGETTPQLKLPPMSPSFQQQQPSSVASNNNLQANPEIQATISPLKVPPGTPISIAESSMATPPSAKKNNKKKAKSYLHFRVAKYFDEALYFGVIVGTKGGRSIALDVDAEAPSVTASTSANDDTQEETLWTILFDDGDKEDWDLGEVKKGIRLAKSQADDTNYNLWEIFNVDDRKNWASQKINKDNGENDEEYFPKDIRKNAEVVAKFFLFLLERQNCWIRRQMYYHVQQQQPQSQQQSSDAADYWTSSGLFRDYYCCNNYRQLDRGTAFFHNHVVRHLWPAAKNRPNKETCTWNEWFEEVLWASYCYRLVNKVESFSKDGKLPTSEFGRIPTRQEWPLFKELVMEFKEIGKEEGMPKFFTGAHQTNGLDSYMAWGDQVADAESTRIKEIAMDADSLESVFHAILTLPGCGTFLSWQIVCDLLESNALPNIKTIDYCVLGKGAKAGIVEIFFNNKQPKRVSNDDYMQCAKVLVRYQDAVYKALKSQDGIALEFPKWRNEYPITLKEMEHALCEFSKFQRIERAIDADKTPLGQRRRKSRRHLDDTLQCPQCQKQLYASKTTTTTTTDAAATISSSPSQQQQQQLHSPTLHQQSPQPQKCKSTRGVGVVILCNTCNQGYCNKCVPIANKDYLYWICKPCLDLEKFEWDVL